MADKQSYDFVIVGGGSAGTVLANRLSANPSLRVCLLEAGPTDRNPLIRIPIGIIGLMRSRSVNWRLWTEPQAQLNHRRLYWPRGKTLGGSSAINAMCYTRGHPSDYDHWAQLGNAGWGYAELLPYFKRAEHFEHGADAYHGVGGPLHVSSLRHHNPLSAAFISAATAVGVPLNNDFNGPQQEGVGLYHVMQKNGARCSNAEAYLHPVRDRPNLHVMTGARVQRLVFSGTRAIGVDCLVQRQPQRVMAEGEVILCGGAIHSPQLLQLSGVGPRAVLAEHSIPEVLALPGVGENLQDHLDISVIQRASTPVGVSLGPRYWWRGLLGGVQYLKHRQGEWTSNLAEAGGFARTQPSLSQPDVQFHFLPAIEIDHGLDLRQTIRHFGYTLRVCDLRPQSRGRITLHSADPNAAPCIDPNYLATEHDMEQMVRAVKLGREILAQAPFDPHRGKALYPGAKVQTDSQLRVYVRAHAESIYHPVGTCKMGRDDMAVVDDQLRVHGLEGLRVVDASIMPTLVGGNTNAPTTAIAERAADCILGAC
ncbi:GMC family oxidoreductase [Salinispirillum marinum]|uniref:GMC family oxidoreductase n=2 Tax=Saccharospirillaceae TaxID=255527 RepID=A0ABV8BCH4_9GAMM